MAAGTAHHEALLTRSRVDNSNFPLPTESNVYLLLTKLYGRKLRRDSRVITEVIVSKTCLRRSRFPGFLGATPPEEPEDRFD
jgi:hypothetical protein